MLIIIFSILMICCGLFLAYKSNLDEFGVLLFVLGGLSIFISIALLIVLHATADYDIITNHEEYHSLLYSIELIDSEYEDISKTELIKDISEWNMKVLSKRHYNDSLWTGWFIPDKVVEEMELIEYPIFVKED